VQIVPGARPMQLVKLNGSRKHTTIRRRRLCAGDGNLGFGVAQPPSRDVTCTSRYKPRTKRKVAWGNGFFASWDWEPKKRRLRRREAWT
jgi:hypothetical protein